MSADITQLLWVCTECKNENCGTAECSECNCWLCRECGNLNFAKRDRCNLKDCQAPKQDGDNLDDYEFIQMYNEKKNKPVSRNTNNNRGSQDNGGQAMNGENDWTCPKCNNVNFGKREMCNRYHCGYARFPWKCPKCGNENFEGRFICNRKTCKAPHPKATQKHIEQHDPQAPHNFGGGQQMGGGQQGRNNNGNNRGMMQNGGPIRNGGNMGGGNRDGPYGGGSNNNRGGRQTQFDRPAGNNMQMPPHNGMAGMQTGIVAGSGPMVMQPLLAADGTPLLINGQQVYTAVPAGMN